jgi:UDP-perosamine 4-acetyltransferase
MAKHVAVLGAGGHAKVVAFVLGLSGYHVVAFTDDDPLLQGRQVLGIPVAGTHEVIPHLGVDAAVVGIGDNYCRQRWYRQLLTWGVPLVNAIHPSALIAQGVVLGQGVAVLARVSINVEAQVGSNAIVNTGAIVGHDCVVGEHAHVGPGAILCGAVRVGALAFLGAGTIVIPSCSIGERSVIGAGTVVLSDVPANVVAVGNPSRVVRGLDGAG